MGYGLFNESVLDSVIVARQRFLRSGGFMLLDVVKLKLQGSSVNEAPINFCLSLVASSLKR